MLLSELPKHRADIHRAFNKGDLTGLAGFSHTLCGGAAYCGAPGLKSLSGNLEALAKAGEQKQIREALEALDREITRLLGD